MHFQLYDVDDVFLLALRAKQREVEQNGVLIHLRPCFVIAGRATNPQGVMIRFTLSIYLLLLIVIHYICHRGCHNNNLRFRSAGRSPPASGCRP